MSRIRVLVVDDSVVVRRLVSDVLAGDPDIEVAGTAPNGRLALTKLDQVAPDLVTMDIEMPDMDGIEAVRRMRAAGSRLPIVMFSTLTERGAAATLDALSAGASDYVTKPANVGSVQESMAQVRSQLIPKIKALVPRRRATSAVLGGVGAAASLDVTAPGTTLTSGATPRTTGTPSLPRRPAAGPVTLAPARARTEPYRVLVVGCSTGGPDALTNLLSGLPATLPVPVLVVQHMPPVFTRQFAARLDRQLPLTVVESAGQEPLRAGTVYIAPGDYHLELVAAGQHVSTRLQQGAPENFCRPAVDVLFRSVAAVYREGVLATVLTGMGSDGRRGAEQIVAAGGSVLVQDEQTSVVWGMPGAVAGAGLAEQVLPLPELAPALVSRLVATNACPSTGRPLARPAEVPAR